MLSEEPTLGNGSPLVLGGEMWLGDPPPCPQQWRDSPPLGSSEEIMCSKRSSAEEKNTWASQIVAAYLTQEGGFLRQVSQEEWQEREGTAGTEFVF